MIGRKVGLMLRTRTAACVALALSIGACKGFADDVRAVMSLAQALNERYRQPVKVNINNRSHLVITFQSAPVTASSADEREAFAREVAVFAREKYVNAQTLDDITVAFIDAKSFGPVNVTSSQGSYVWTIAELKPESPD